MERTLAQKAIQENDRRFYPGRKKRGSHDELDDHACRETEGEADLSAHNHKTNQLRHEPHSHQAQSYMGVLSNKNHRQFRAVGTPAPTAVQGF